MNQKRPPLRMTHAAACRAGIMRSVAAPIPESSPKRSSAAPIPESSPKRSSLLGIST